MYGDSAKEILKGCSCGGRFFFYIKKERLKQSEPQIKLTEEEKKQIEHDVRDMLGIDYDEERAVILDMESIRVLKPGKYKLDLVNLFSKQPLVFRLEEGKYIIDVAESLRQTR